MEKRINQGFIAGLLGAVILTVLAYLLQAVGGIGTPGFTATYRAIYGDHGFIDHLAAVVLFVLSGAAWGAVFGWLVTGPTVLKGALFGFIPSLWLWLVVAPATGQPLFNGFSLQGLLLPILFNVVVWGSFVGWYSQR